MSKLSEDHNYLYKRVRLKAIVHIYFGLVFMLFPADANPQNGAISTIQSGIGNAIKYFGVGYFIIGIMIAIGLYLSRRNYLFARQAMAVATSFNLFWLLLILLANFQHTTRGLAYIFGQSAYLTYNCYLIWRDPGWAAIRIVNQIKQENEDERTAPTAK